MTLGALAVPAPLGLEVGAAVEWRQVAQRRVADEHHVAPASTVAAVGPALGHVRLAPEGDGAVSARPGTDEDCGAVVEHTPMLDRLHDPMPWVEILVALGVSHLAGDFLLQTEWQAMTKTGGLRRGGEALRALLAHCTTYLLAYVPVLVWLADDLGAQVLGVAALIYVPHMLQDDGWAIRAYMRSVKHTEPDDHPVLVVAVDQSAHVVVLALTALLISG